MSYGITLVNEAGNPWVTPSSIPIAFHSRQDFWIQDPRVLTAAEIYYDTSKPCFAFVVCYGGDSRPKSAETRTLYLDGKCRVEIIRGENNKNVSVYFFTIHEQPPTPFGINIWDENGKLIINNETRTLSDVASIGGGINAREVRGGKWGVVPLVTGMITGVITSGGMPRPYQAEYYANAYFDGNNTTISSVENNSPGGNISGVTWHNMNNHLLCVDLSRYD